jgi:hypothetical protein
MFATLLPLVGPTVFTRAVSTRTPAMTSVEAPVTLLRGEATFPLLVAALQRLAQLMPAAELVVVPESHDRGLDPAGTAREIAASVAR